MTTPAAVQAQPILSARGIVNRFGQQVVHDHLNLDIVPGEIIGIAGGDDVFYRIHFSDSVSGLSVGDQVKFRGVDVGTVKSIMIDPDNSSLVLVELQLRKDTPVKTDTRASLALKGPTGAVFIELSGGDPAAETLLAVTPPDTIPEIPSEKTGLKAMLDELPKLVAKFGALEGEVKKIVANARALTEKLKADPSLLLRGPEKKEKKEKTKEEENNDHGWQ